jgi:hypothetical protein
LRSVRRPWPFRKTRRRWRAEKYLYESRGCTDCHGKDGLGRTLIDNGDLVVRGPNITSQGAVADYSVTDWVRSIRHGIAPDLRPLMVMPSEDYAQ